MSRRLVPLMLATGVIALAACTPAEPEPAAPGAPATAITPTAVADIPDAVRAAVLAARPGMTIAEAELKEREGRRYYDVEGTVDGAEIELDLLETPQGWQVVEIQRDLAWTAVPAAVRSAAETARAGFVPVRVIESVQAEDGAVIYELFADGQPATPALEIRAHDGRVEVLKEVWPH
ncbi:PepSY-like domain-containing protein [Roseibacterium beibuensis]|uniref:PepSY-like domain-containing protein n=1 Tax=[Roseibacterium] beibuensis TaxID=1193142 RepID=UPI00217DA5B5|nr:PepSY-like domain-containing protein [Roseibacterium beibuensis]MCS6625336.1 PepSY-like domain-containing protein [Roseibacterium beibuensis]